GAAARRSVDLRSLGRLDQTLDLFLGEAGQAPHVRGDRDGHRIVVALAPHAAQVEALVDALLELDRAPPTLGVALGEPRQPLRAHADVRDLVGQDEIDGTLEDRVADLPRDVHELVKDVARQPFEAAVDARDARRRVLGAGAAPEDGRLRELPGVPLEVLEQPQVDLDVARFVPDLPCHVHRELPRRVRKIAHGPPGALHRLQLTHHDAVHTLLDGLAGRQVRERWEPLGDLQLGDVAGAHPDETIIPRELVVSDRAIHAGASRGCARYRPSRGWGPACRGAPTDSGMNGCSSKCKRAVGAWPTRLARAA